MQGGYPGTRTTTDRYRQWQTVPARPADIALRPGMENVQPVLSASCVQWPGAASASAGRSLVSSRGMA